MTERHDDDLPRMEWTLGDIYDLGDDETKDRIDKELEDHAARWEQLGLVDADQLRLVRTGGHTVQRTVDRMGAVGVQVTNYRPGPRYGGWDISCSPDGTKVVIDHTLPTAYGVDGNFDESQWVEGWSLPMEAWRSNPMCLAELLGKVVAREVVGLFNPPDTIAPDAGVGA